MWVRLILENSTVCLISRRISLFCPVGIDFVLIGPLFWGLVGVGVAVSLTMILTMCQFRFLSWMWLLLIFLWPFWVVGLVFDGEFDPGSGRTLAACLTHASRAERPLCGTRAANG